MQIQQLNFNHLLYFWVVATEGSITRAATRLHLTQPTISSQLGALEGALGQPLFMRRGKRLLLNDTGRQVFRYADEIFGLGHELLGILRGQQPELGMRLHVGVADVMPKLVVRKILEPLFKGPERIRITCLDDDPEKLLGDLLTHKLDVVLADAPYGYAAKGAAYNHLLGECAVTIFATAPLARTLRRHFPKSLDGAPMLLPTSNTALRRSLDQWFDQQGIRPDVRGEMEDSALLKTFGEIGLGAFAAPSIIESEIVRQYRVKAVGRAGSLKECFYAVSTERKIRHPAVLTIIKLVPLKVFKE